MIKAIRRFFQYFLFKPIVWYNQKYSASPNRKKVKAALSELLRDADLVTKEPTTLAINCHQNTHKFIIFSDQHKGTRNGADDFASNEACYIAALQEYQKQGFTLINLGDCEELWENLVLNVIEKNKAVFAAEAAFIDQQGFVKVYGNHDVLWRFDPLAPIFLERMFGKRVPVFGAVLLNLELQADQHLRILATHGHQGDEKSDNNWLVAWFVSSFWEPFQSFLQINPNTPAFNRQLKSLHNQIMYEWSQNQENLLLITGHTHQPVFRSQTELEWLYAQLEDAREKKDETLYKSLAVNLPNKFDIPDLGHPQYRKLKPSYFNSGCCCFNDTTITGIEIADGFIRLVKWEGIENQAYQRTVVRASKLEDLYHQLNNSPKS